MTMNNNPGALTLVVGYDFSALGDRALAIACALSSHYAVVELHVVSVLDSTLQARGLIEDTGYDDASTLQKRLATVTERLPSRFNMVRADFYAHTRIGDAAEEILRLATEVRADLIVVGTHGHDGLRRLVLGSVAESVTRNAHCPVLCARPKDYEAEAPAPQPEPAGPGMKHRLEPHVYSYQQDIAPTRPVEWPLY